jgi:hypothetical protein
MVIASGDFTMIKNDDFPMKNGDFPMTNGDFPMKNGDFPMTNGDFSGKHRKKLLKMAQSKIVDLTMNSMVDLSSSLCDSLPEGTMIDCSLQ